ncbi:MAG: NAD(P)-dependent glycerol-3-phosphate dehydrogenase [Clostridia bacterium]|nr:NAD(P)-dependent glycerol-3-phosphate dehydrogenase [Clostridia bacterium]
MKICVLGAGTWGTALASLLAKNQHEVVLWSKIPEEIKGIKESGTHRNLPGVILPTGIEYTSDIERAIHGADMILFVTPSEFIRSTAREAARYISPRSVIVSAAKGIESGTLMTMTEIIADEIKRADGECKNPLAALSGPTHAEEVAIGLPTSIVAACEDEKISSLIADVFKNSCMRVYMNTDVNGVELCGALKNIIAIAAGICRGVDFGDNAVAMLITRGMAEITRLGLAMGCKKETFWGLAGIGDLIVTATSSHSRNNRCGELIGRGKSYAEALSEIGMVVEGYHALGAAVELSKRYSVEMPITEGVYEVMHNSASPYAIIRSLMTREIKNELKL